MVHALRKPVPPPLQEALWQKYDARALEVLGKVIEPTVRGRYLHWDKLRHLQPPEGLTREEWWFGLKLRRTQNRRIPLVDVSGSSFSFNLPDPLPECLHHVDSMARGVIQQPEPVTNPETRDRYLVRSLIEESITSSQLEGASTTREVAKEMIRQGREPRDRSERMILNNYRTMQRIIELREENLNEELIFELHRLVTDGTLDDPTGIGRLRGPHEEIVVGDEFGEVFHVPPPAGELERRHRGDVRLRQWPAPRADSCIR